MGREQNTVLVTGANAGIGRATVVELADRGLDVVGTVRSDEKAAVVREAAEEAGVEVATVLLDVTDADRCAEVIEDVRPDVLVNNAGIAVTAAIEDVEDERARHALEVMTLAPIRLARLCLPHMRERGGGRIVNVSSIYGRIATALNGWYQAAKHGLEAATDALRVEVARDDIVVILIQPGFIRTGLVEQARHAMDEYEGSSYEEAYARLYARMRFAQPFMKEPEDAAKAIARAVTTRAPQSRYLVGVDARAAAAADQATPSMVWDRMSRIFLGL